MRSHEYHHRWRGVVKCWKCHSSLAEVTWEDGKVCIACRDDMRGWKW